MPLLGVLNENKTQCVIYIISLDKNCYPLPPEELLEEVVLLRLSAPISRLTRVRRSVDILFLEDKRGQERRGAKLKSVCSDTVREIIFTLPYVIFRLKNKVTLLIYFPA